MLMDLTGKKIQESRCLKMFIKNQELFEKARSLKFELDASLLNLVLEKKNIQVQDDVDSLAIDLFLENFVRLAKKKWREAGSHTRSMNVKFGRWLDQEADIPNLNPQAPTKKTPNSTPRKTKDFCDLSDRSKRRETAQLRTENSSNKLMHAATSSLMASGNADAAHILSQVQESPGRAKKMRRLSGIAASMEKPPSKDVSLPRKINDDDALAHLFHADLTRDAYISCRLMSKSHGADIWPVYHDVLAAKILCRPNGISYDETAVIVPLEERLKHNDKRLFQLCQDQFQDLLKEVPENGILEVEGEAKIGFDGSTGNSIYNQAFSIENRDVSEDSLLSTCLVPLQYKIKGGDVLFKNPKPQGTTFCQPVRLEYRKETPQASKEIDAWIDTAVTALAQTPNSIKVGSKTVKFLHKLLKTMMDVKAKNACTDITSALRCFICLGTPRFFNDLKNLLRLFPTDESKLIYGGVCDLHCWLRAFDGVNHLSDKLTVKKWKILSKEHKEVVASRKVTRNAAYKSRLNLNVDVPRAGGAGNSNTGNVARRAFQNEDIFADITGVNVEHMMLIVINANYAIDEQKFKDYGLKTAELWVALYPWCYMPLYSSAVLPRMGMHSPLQSPCQLLLGAVIRVLQ